MKLMVAVIAADGGGGRGCGGRVRSRLGAPVIREPDQNAGGERERDDRQMLLQKPL